MRACRCSQAFNKVALEMGLKHSGDLVFGTMDGTRFSGFAESVDIFDGLPRVVVFVSTDPRTRLTPSPLRALIEFQALM